MILPWKYILFYLNVFFVVAESQFVRFILNFEPEVLLRVATLHFNISVFVFVPCSYFIKILMDLFMPFAHSFNLGLWWRKCKEDSEKKDWKRNNGIVSLKNGPFFLFSYSTSFWFKDWLQFFSLLSMSFVVSIYFFFLTNDTSFIPCAGRMKIEKNETASSQSLKRSKKSNSMEWNVLEMCIVSHLNMLFLCPFRWCFSSAHSDFFSRFIVQIKERIITYLFVLFVFSVFLISILACTRQIHKHSKKEIELVWTRKENVKSVRACPRFFNSTYATRTNDWFIFRLVSFEIVIAKSFRNELSKLKKFTLYTVQCTLKLN